MVPAKLFDRNMGQWYVPLKKPRNGLLLWKLMTGNRDGCLGQYVYRKKPTSPKMKSQRTYPLIVVFLTLFGCADTEQPLLPEALTGTWEEDYAIEHTGFSLVQVESFTFFDNGAYTRFLGFREPGADRLLGYRFVVEGTYQLEGRRLLLQETDRRLHVGQLLYGDFDLLSPVNPYAASWADLSINENKTLLEMYLPCNPISSARCQPKKVLRKRMVEFSGSEPEPNF